ncbi:hypothetical protein DMENIID0001_001540 [Sergentomyia squamirostris]
MVTTDAYGCPAKKAYLVPERDSEKAQETLAAFPLVKLLFIFFFTKPSHHPRGYFCLAGAHPPNCLGYYSEGLF